MTMAISNNLPIRCVLAVVAISFAAASNDSSQGAALRGASAADSPEPRRVQEVPGTQLAQGAQTVQGNGVVQGGVGPQPVQGEGVVPGSSQQPTQDLPFNLDNLFSNGHDMSGWLEHAASVKGYVTRFVVLMIFGLLYWCCIVSKYPKLMGPSHTSARLQNENELNATCQTSFANCLYSWLCSQARAAHTFDSAGVCNYWPSLILMTLCPCLTLYFMNSCSNLNENLGGRKKDCCSGLICALCCSCCVIAQDAESLDMATGARTKCCGVEAPPDMYPGGGMPPQHQMHHMYHGHHGYHMPHQQQGFMVNPQRSYGQNQSYPIQQY